MYTIHYSSPFLNKDFSKQLNFHKRWFTISLVVGIDDSLWLHSWSDFDGYSTSSLQFDFIR